MHDYIGSDQAVGASLYQGSEQATGQAATQEAQVSQREPAGSQGIQEALEASRDYFPLLDTIAPSREEVERELDSLSRKPFQRILKDYLGFVPTPEALRRFANRYPDKWASALGILAQLAGYKKDVVEVNNVVMIGHMDDAALFKRLQAAEAQLRDTNRMIAAQQVPSSRELSPSRDPDIIDIPASSVREQVPKT